MYEKSTLNSKKEIFDKYAHNAIFTLKFYENN